MMSGPGVLLFLKTINKKDLKLSARVDHSRPFCWKKKISLYFLYTILLFFSSLSLVARFVVVLLFLFSIKITFFSSALCETKVEMLWRQCGILDMAITLSRRVPSRRPLRYSRNNNRNVHRAVIAFVHVLLILLLLL